MIIHSTRVQLLMWLLLVSSCKSNTGNNKLTQTNKESEKPVSKEKEEIYIFNPQKPYPFEKGKLEYRYSGDYEGKQTVYFADYGLTYRVEEDYVNKLTPSNDHVDQVFIRTPDKFYFYDKQLKKGYYVDQKDSNFDFQGNLLHDFTTIGIDSTMKKNGYKHSGHEDISGKRCQVYKSADGKSQFCFWNGINIKTQMTGKKFGYLLEANDIDKSPSIGTDMFAPASDIKILPYDKYVKSETRDKL